MTTSNKQKAKDMWIAGYACACAVIAKEDGFVGSGASLARQGGFNLKDMKDANIEKIDIDDLKKDGLK